MQLSVKGKQIDVGDALRSHVEAQLKDIVGKYFSDSLDAHVTFSREGQLFRTDIAVHAGRGIMVQSNGTANEPYPAFDQAAQRIAQRLRRYKTKLRDHKHASVRNDETMIAKALVLQSDGHDKEEEAADNPVIVAEMMSQIETLTVSEAVMRLDLGDLPALMFKNRAHGGFNMIYRRPDGNIGWIDPANTGAMAHAAPNVPSKHAKA